MRVGLAVLGVVVMAWLAIQLPCLLNAIDRGKQKQAMSEIREIASQIDEVRKGKDPHFELSSIAELAELCGEKLPAEDPWGNPYNLQSIASSYAIVSYGKRGAPDVSRMELYESAVTVSFESDIVFRDGQFIQYPEGL